MEIESVLTNMFRNKIMRYVLTIYLLIVVIMFIYSSFTLGGKTVKSYAILSEVVIEQLEELSVDFNELQNRQDELEKVLIRDPKIINEISTMVKILEAASQLDMSKLPIQMGELENRVNIISGDFKQLKSSLNPTDPSEIFTVVRLGDKFELFQTQLLSIESKLVELEQSTEAKIQRNYDLIDAQIDRFIGMFKWLFLLLIPIILNTIREFIRSRGETIAPVD